MPRRNSRSAADDFFEFLVEMPWWIGPICAAVFFLFLRFIIPAIMVRAGSDLPNPGQQAFSAPLVMVSTRLAPWVAVAAMLVWGLALLKKLTNRRRLDKQTGLDSIRDLSWQEFEELVAEAFRRQDYEVELRGSAAGDGGVDVVLRRKGQKTLVQCKHWTTWKVDVKMIRELRGVMASEKSDYGIVVTYGAFTSEAEVFASENRITLIGGNDLVEMIRPIQRGAHIPAKATLAPPAPIQIPAASAGGATPTCPRCGSSMARRMAKRGVNAGSEFWGCSRYPGCQGTRPL